MVVINVKPMLVNMSQDKCIPRSPRSSIMNQYLLKKSELVLIDNSFTQNNLFLVKKMLVTTSPEEIIPLISKLMILFLAESENQLINIHISKVSLYLILLVVLLVVVLDLDQVQVLSYQKESLLITVRNLNQVSLFIHFHKIYLKI